MNAAAHQRNTLPETFAELRRQRRIALIPFVPAGYPDLKTTTALLPALEAAGASAIEVGFPFSDPIADGPTIQESFTAALEKKIRVGDVFAAVAAARGKVALPLVSMVSYSIVYRYGLSRFLTDATQAGFDGLILPDLPPPEAQRICDQVRAAGLQTILMIAPTTAPLRRAEIAKLSSGFVYYLSIAGITGERDALPRDLPDNLRQLRGVTDTPICVGFGIHLPQHVAQLATMADGAIVGSAYVKRMKQHLHDGPQALATLLQGYTRELLSQAG